MSDRGVTYGVSWTHQADRDRCPDTGHRYDLDCDWRSEVERTAHAFVTRNIHKELVHCEHRPLGSLCFELATAALDALYENGWRVDHG